MNLHKTWSCTFQHKFTIQYYYHFSILVYNYSNCMTILHKIVAAIFNSGSQFKLQALNVIARQFNSKNSRQPHKCSKISLMISKIFLKLIAKYFIWSLLARGYVVMTIGFLNCIWFVYVPPSVYKSSNLFPLL